MTSEIRQDTGGAFAKMLAKQRAMKSLHTPGPWTFDGLKVEGDSDGHRHDVALVQATPFHLRETEDAFANARLIAAAPELFKVCKAALADYAQGVADEEVDGDNPVLAALRKAVAQVEGSGDRT
jgi:hypothetical protein